MKTFLKAAGLAIAVAIGFAAAPQSASAQTLVVNVDQIYTDSVAGKNGVSQLEAKYSARIKTAQGNLETAAKGWNEQLEAAKKLVKPDGSVPPATETAIGQARQKLDDARQQFDAVRQEIQYINEYIKYQIVDKLVPITEKIRKDRKATAVIPRGSVLAFDPAIDVTAAAMQQLDATLTTVSIVPPQQGQAAAPAAGAAAPAQPAKQQPQSR